MKGLRLYKKEKLCSPVAVDRLFSRGGGAMGFIAYPLRAVWMPDPARSSDAPVSFLISVPKKRLRHAVDRVTMRRRIREAYRLCRPDFPLPARTRLNVAFIYVADRVLPYSNVDRALRRIMQRICDSLQPLNDDAQPATPPQSV